jgi:hypothetical protein
MKLYACMFDAGVASDCSEVEAVFKHEGLMAGVALLLEARMSKAGELEWEVLHCLATSMLKNLQPCPDSSTAPPSTWQLMEKHQVRSAGAGTLVLAPEAPLAPQCKPFHTSPLS